MSRPSGPAASPISTSCRAAGVDPYPVRFDRDRTLGELRAEFGDLPPGTLTDVRVRVAGRILLLRRQGKLTFATVRDQSGSMQLFVDRKVLGDDEHAAFNALDLGDWVGVDGTVMTTKKGELSVNVDGFQLLAKALRPLPDKWHGLSDVDTRFRQRYVDLIVNDDARRVFEVRFAAVAALRRELADLGFAEVETPVLSHELGGATARPFVTHHNTLGTDLYLRIALELHLKRLVVGGFERVFEIGRVFRNEGIDTSHNPEFTMLEAYQAFADYHDMMELTERLVVAAAHAARAGDTVLDVRGTTVDLAEPWPRATMVDLIREHVGVEITPAMTVESATRGARRPGPHLRGLVGRGAPHARGLRRAGGAEAGAADVRAGPPTRDVAPRSGPPRRPHPRRALRGGGRRQRAGERLQRAQRSRRPAPPVRGGGAGPGGRRPRGGHGRRGLPPRVGVRSPAHRGTGHRHRPPRHAACRGHEHPRGHPLPDAAPRGVIASTILLDHPARPSCSDQKGVPLSLRLFRRLLPVAALVACLSVAGMGVAHTATVPPGKWAPKFCNTIDGYQKAITEQSAAVSTALAGVGDLTTGRAEIVSFLGKMVTAAKTAARQVKKAGSPSTPNGAKIAAKFVSGLEASAKVFAGAKAQAAKLPTTTPAAFQNKGKQLGTDLTKAGDKLSKSFDGIGKLDKGKKLEAAVKATPECAFLTS